MLTEELKKLILESTEDGQITDKEREIIRNKAEADGCDPDEAELFIEKQLKQPHSIDAFLKGLDELNNRLQNEEVLKINQLTVKGDERRRQQTEIEKVRKGALENYIANFDCGDKKQNIIAFIECLGNLTQLSPSPERFPCYHRGSAFSPEAPVTYKFLFS